MISEKDTQFALVKSKNHASHTVTLLSKQRKSSTLLETCDLKNVLLDRMLTCIKSLDEKPRNIYLILFSVSIFYIIFASYWLTTGTAEPEGVTVTVTG